jgi:hypothetical protein
MCYERETKSLETERETKREREGGERERERERGITKKEKGAVRENCKVMEKCAAVHS